MINLSLKKSFIDISFVRNHCDLIAYIGRHVTRLP